MKLTVITTNNHLRKDDLIRMLDKASMMMSDVPDLKPGETITRLIEIVVEDRYCLRTTDVGTLMVEG